MGTSSRSPRVHHVKMFLNDGIRTACGRDGYFDEDNWLLSTWHCSREGITCQMIVTHEKKRVTCRQCIKRLDLEVSPETHR
jgi:hypothetical protein